MLNSLDYTNILFSNPIGEFTNYLRSEQIKKNSVSYNKQTKRPSLGLNSPGHRSKRRLSEIPIEKTNEIVIAEAKYMLVKANTTMKRMVTNTDNFKAKTKKEGWDSCKNDFDRSTWKLYQLNKKIKSLFKEHDGNPLNFSSEDFCYILQDNLIKTGMSLKLAEFIALHTNQSGTLQWPVTLLTPITELAGDLNYIATFKHNIVEVYTEKKNENNNNYKGFTLANDRAIVVVKQGIECSLLKPSEEGEQIFAFNQDPKKSVYFVNQYSLQAQTAIKEPTLTFGQSWLEFPINNSDQKAYFNLCYGKLTDIDILLQQGILNNKYHLDILGYFVDTLAKIADTPQKYLFDEKFAALRPSLYQK